MGLFVSVVCKRLPLLALSLFVSHTNICSYAPLLSVPWPRRPIRASTNGAGGPEKLPKTKASDSKTIKASASVVLVFCGQTHRLHGQSGILHTGHGGFFVVIFFSASRYACPWVWPPFLKTS